MVTIYSTLGSSTRNRARCRFMGYENKWLSICRNISWQGFN